MEDESLELALADVEILRSAYPDETSCCCATGSGCSQFPLHVTLHLSETAYIELEIVTGYPVSSNVQVATYRSTAIERQRLERAVALVRATSAQCLEDGTEGGLACCAVAFDAWNDSGVQEALGNVTESSLLNVVSSSSSPTVATFEWISGKPLHDRKSTFQAHMCRLESEADVRPAVQQLLNNSKLQRATHNMYAYRLVEKLDVRKKSSSDGDDAGDTITVTVLKHDNDDDGEDGAGSRLAHLLQMRNADGVLVVVSRWFGGIELGPKRFAHITSTAQALLAKFDVDSNNKK